jgi:hypothetical protein
MRAMHCDHTQLAHFVFLNCALSLHRKDQVDNGQDYATHTFTWAVADVLVVTCAPLCRDYEHIGLGQRAARGRARAWGTTGVVGQ